MFHFIPVTGVKQKLGEEKLLENWTFMSTTLKLNDIKPFCVVFKSQLS